MLGQSFLVCVLIGLVLQTSYCQGEDTDETKDPVFLPEEDLNPYRESITWDVQTAHANLTVTGDWKTATLGNRNPNIDNNAKRFIKDPCIFGSAGYQSGTHYWLAGGDGGWLVGVAAESVQRKDFLILDPSAGVYAIARSNDQKPEKVGVYLDCDNKHVSFLDASTREVLLDLSIDCTEPIHPFALVGVGSIKLE